MRKRSIFTCWILLSTSFSEILLSFWENGAKHMPEDKFSDRTELTVLCPAGQNNWFEMPKMISGIWQQQSVSNAQGWKLLLSITNCRLPHVTSVNMAQGFEEDNFKDDRIKNIKNSDVTFHDWALPSRRYSINPHKNCVTNYCYWKWIEKILF